MPLVFIPREHNHLHVDLLTLAAPYLNSAPSAKSLLSYSISDHAAQFIITPCSKLSCEYIAQCVYPQELISSADYEQLSKCYHTIFNTALNLKCQSIAIPLSTHEELSKSTIERMIEVIIQSYNQFSQSVRAKKKILHTYILLGSVDIFELSEHVFAQLSPYVSDENELAVLESSLYKESLNDFLKDKHESFTTMLLRLIHDRGISEIDCYKKANIDRKLFSKIRNTPDYQPTKLTAMSFALALELNIKEATLLLKSAGLSFSSCHMFDRIIEFHIRHGIYDKERINKALLKHHLTPLML